ncbi:small acid-soluble spore protein K (minor) [Peribacillus deserti]|uniref:Small, acid-soluble spore protein K n=1 Tax=Peribacillus deserti TaxID=673318 RepID=A0ABS2QKB6_9BACI|nr:small, acid-soluble spore protein K [Peribacillus deserti]MBM7693607.1 small acid-soluble spore protein K (minor) [Peribacillus deserti]
MSNKDRIFPSDVHGNDAGPRAKAEYASKRADGTINTHPQERMKASSLRAR